MESERGGVLQGEDGGRGASESGQHNSYSRDIDPDVPRPFSSRTALPDCSICGRDNVRDWGRPSACSADGTNRSSFNLTQLPPVGPGLMLPAHGTVDWNLGKVNGRENWSSGGVVEGVKVGTEKRKVAFWMIGFGSVGVCKGSEAAAGESLRRRRLRTR